MSIWTREELITAIGRWKKAYLAVSGGKSYAIDGRSLTYQDVATINRELDRLQAELDTLDGKRSGLQSFRVRMKR